MPYNAIIDYSAFELMFSGRFYTLSSFRDLSSALNSCDFSVVESRRECHRAVVAFMDGGRLGENVFSDNDRFPAGLRNCFVSSSDVNLQNWFASMTSALSYRSTAIAKDSEAGAIQESDRHFLARDAGLQDSTKRFEELKKVLNLFLAAPMLRWNRNTFEEKVAGVWT